jgi:hypothetical protein
MSWLHSGQKMRSFPAPERQLGHRLTICSDPSFEHGSIALPEA